MAYASLNDLRQMVVLLLALFVASKPLQNAVAHNLPFALQFGVAFVKKLVAEFVQRHVDIELIVCSSYIYHFLLPILQSRLGTGQLPVAAPKSGARWGAGVKGRPPLAY